ncbi:DUF6308 family protein [Galactobacter valiniphilus]|uniref:DUF6308 family protein n=1 Tax=Galactobacter valiniphilus TaxID=2676122 RepID=UPI003734EF5B
MTVTLPDAFESFLANLLDPANQDVHVDRLSRYMDGGAYTGAAFETLTMPDADANHINVSDLAALWTLSVPLKWKQSAALLAEHRDALAAALVELPDRPLADLTSDEIKAMHKTAHPAMVLWTGIRKVKRMGPTRTSKLMARKRPQLIPIYDSFVKEVLGLESSKDQWRQFYLALTRKDREVDRRLLELGRLSGHPELSALRVFDILVWMKKRDGDLKDAQ